MMLRKYNFPSIALHSMMKQVSDGQIWEMDAFSSIPEPEVCPSSTTPVDHNIPHTDLSLYSGNDLQL